MPPPSRGSEVLVVRPGKLTRYNDDNTANVKLSKGPGRPHKVHLDDFVDVEPDNDDTLTFEENEPTSFPWRLFMWLGSIFGTIGAGVWSGVLQKIGEWFFMYLASSV